MVSDYHSGLRLTINVNVSDDNHPYIAICSSTLSASTFYFVLASCVTSCAAVPTAAFHVTVDLVVSKVLLFLDHITVFEEGLCFLLENFFFRSRSAVVFYSWGLRLVLGGAQRLSRELGVLHCWGSWLFQGIYRACSGPGHASTSIGYPATWKKMWCVIACRVLERGSVVLLGHCPWWSSLTLQWIGFTALLEAEVYCSRTSVSLLRSCLHLYRLTCSLKGCGVALHLGCCKEPALFLVLLGPENWVLLVLQ